MSDNTIRVRFRSFDAWLRVNPALWSGAREEFPDATDAEIERFLLRVYRNQLVSDREKLMRFVNSCSPGYAGGITRVRNSKGKEVNRHAD